VKGLDAVNRGSPRRRARRGEGERTRQEILEAAERLLVETGSAESVSIRSIAEAVGVTPPAIYVHFTDKDDLFFQLSQERFGVFRDVLRRAFSSSSDPVEGLSAAGRAYVDFALKNSSHYKVLFMTDTPLPANMTVEETVGFGMFMDLVGNVQAGMDAGVFRKGDAFTAATSIWACVHGLVSLMIGAKDFPWPEDPAPLVDFHLSTVMHGLKARS
jgi:AcrR family transcriptional regulator